MIKKDNHHKAEVDAREKECNSQDCKDREFLILGLCDLLSFCKTAIENPQHLESNPIGKKSLLDGIDKKVKQALNWL